MESILIVDDELGIRSSIRMVLEYEGYEVTDAEDGTQALELARRHRPDLVLLDFKMPILDGIDTLQKLKSDYPDLPVIMLSGHGSISTAVQATKLGAYDFLEKPADRERILLTVHNALEFARIKSKQRDIKPQIKIVGQSLVFIQLLDLARRVAVSDLSVLIRGESGTGKELIAHDIHHRSKRSEQTFINVNCAAIPEDLIESELFGHEKGSFTGAADRLRGKFELAHKGTLFLDEIGDMSIKTQAKVLRAIQNGEYQRVGGTQTLHSDVRIISATNQDLEEMISEGTFRQDLYYRISAVPITLPPLRERTEDIPLLVNYFVEKFNQSRNVANAEFSEDAIEFLKGQPWFGNIRELKNMIERNLILARSSLITKDDVRLDLERFSPDRIEKNDLIPTRDSLADHKNQSEKQYIIRKLEENNWNIKATSLAIGTPRSNLYKRMQHLNIERRTK